MKTSFPTRRSSDLTSTASSHARLSRLASIETLVWTLAIDGLHRITLEIYAPLGDCASRQPYQPSAHLPGLPPSGQFAADQGLVQAAGVVAGVQAGNRREVRAAGMQIGRASSSESVGQYV